MKTLFNHSIRTDLLILYLSDCAAIFIVVIFMMSQNGQIKVPVDLVMSMATALVMALFAGIVGAALGLYRVATFANPRRAVFSAMLASLILFLFAKILINGAIPDETAHTLPVNLVFGTVAAMMLTRLGFALVHRSSRRIAYVGAVDHGTASGLREGGALRRRYQPFEVTLALPAAEKLMQALQRGRLRAWRIWAVVTAVSAPMPVGLRRQCDAAGLLVFTEAEFSERGLNRIDIENLPPGWLEACKAAHTSNTEAALRRVIDVTVASAILIFTLPLLLLSMLAVRIDSPGPVFYRQERVGKGQRPFMLLKLRSMIVNAEPGGTARWATQCDARVTRVGRFLRLSRIDEIPQVFNVLRGDMSIVGPRPERPRFVEQLQHELPHYNARAIVKPGITGWAQVNYPYGASVEDARIKLTYDLYYVRRRSLFLDLLILIATVRVVLFQEGSR